MSTVDTTTTVTTDTSVQQGKQLTVQSQSNTVTVGDFVTDATIQPYIASRIVSFYAYNLRPKQRVHIFFDSVLVDQYCAPGIVPESISSTADYHSIEKNGNWGDQIITDAFGQVAGQFMIPAATFKTGDRVLEILDTDSIALGTDAFTTKASASFTASNLSVTKKVVTLTTVNPEVSWIPVTNTVVTTNTTQTIVIHPDIAVVQGTYEPIAQGLTINTPSGEAGIFATSLDLYFKQKSQVVQNGVTVYLCETNNGYPDGSKVLPFSTVHLPYSSINISSDSSVPTTFTFDSPVFLNNGSEYAFVVKPDAGDPDYWVYSAELGNTDIQTGTQVFQQPLMGTAFYGATDTEWTALQKEYIKFELKRAKFTHQTGDAYFYNTNTDFVTVYNVGYVNTSAGILPGDYVFQSTNAWTNTVNSSVHGIVNSYDSVKEILYVANSTGNFTNNSYIQVHRFANTFLATTPGANDTTLIAYANTGALHNPTIDALVPQFATVVPGGTALSFKYKGTSNNYSVDSKEYSVNSGTDTEFYDKERIVASKTNEVNQMAGAKSLTLHASLATDSELISPVIDTVKNQELVISNDLDPVDFIYEEFFNSGASKSKYVSKVITLAPGQDAEDLQVILSAFRPNGTDIQVWVKFLNGEDSDPITAKTWLPMINVSGDVYSSPGNPDDIREFVFTVPKYYGMFSTNGTITATNTSTSVVGSSTLFTQEVKNGWYINMLANSTFIESSRKVVAIADDNHLTLNQPFNGNYSACSYFVVVPPTTPYLSANTATQLSGTVSVNTSVNVITGVGTNFTGEVVPGAVINIPGSDSQKVIAVTNSTSMTIGTPWSSNISGANAYNVSPTGVTYLNSNLNQYSTFKSFQIKFILQSNDSSQAPLVNDVRALALQL